MLALVLGAYPGTHEEPRLEAAASYVAGKPVSVWCADSREAWTALVVPFGGSPNANGFSFVGGTEAYFSVPVCDELLEWPRTSLGRGVLTLSHEATHLRGVRDESATECAALAFVPAVASGWYVTRDYFENMTPWVLRDVVDAAWASHRALPPAYTRDC